MMKCAELVTTFLADYVDGRLAPDVLADFEHHLDVCVSCVAYLRTYRSTIAMTGAARAAEDDVPEELVQVILKVQRHL